MLSGGGPDDRREPRSAFTRCGLVEFGGPAPAAPLRQPDRPANGRFDSVLSDDMVGQPTAKICLIDDFQAQTAAPL